MPDMAPRVSSSRASSFCALLALHRLGQQSLQQSQCLQRLAKSWLAAARNRDLAAFACSACRLATSSAFATACAR